MRWSGLEYLKVPQWRTAFETADVIFGVDVAAGREILVFGRGALEMITVTGVEDGLRVLRVSIDGAGDELELLIAACEAYRGHHAIKRSHDRRDLRQRDLLARPTSTSAPASSSRSLWARAIAARGQREFPEALKGRRGPDNQVPLAPPHLRDAAPVSWPAGERPVAARAQEDRDHPFGLRPFSPIHAARRGGPAGGNAPLSPHVLWYVKDLEALGGRDHDFSGHRFRSNRGS